MLLIIKNRFLKMWSQDPQVPEKKKNDMLLIFINYATFPYDL